MGSHVPGVSSRSDLGENRTWCWSAEGDAHYRPFGIKLPQVQDVKRTTADAPLQTHDFRCTTTDARLQTRDYRCTTSDAPLQMLDHRCTTTDARPDSGTVAVPRHTCPRNHPLLPRLPRPRLLLCLVHGRLRPAGRRIEPTFGQQVEGAVIGV